VALAHALDGPAAADLARRGRSQAARFSWSVSAEATREAYRAAVRRRAERP
jgi:hypothetical protein